MKNKQPNVIGAMRAWYDHNIAEPSRIAELKRAEVRKAQAASITYTECTADDLEMIAALRAVTFCPGTGTKRFAQDLQGRTTLSDRQRLFLRETVVRFRRQIRPTIVAKARAALEAK